MDVIFPCCCQVITHNVFCQPVLGKRTQHRLNKNTTCYSSFGYFWALEKHTADMEQPSFEMSSYISVFSLHQLLKCSVLRMHAAYSKMDGCGATEQLVPVRSFISNHRDVPQLWICVTLMIFASLCSPCAVHSEVSHWHLVYVLSSAVDQYLRT